MKGDKFGVSFFPGGFYPGLSPFIILSRINIKDIIDLFSPFLSIAEQSQPILVYEGSRTGIHNIYVDVDRFPHLPYHLDRYLRWYVGNRMSKMADFHSRIIDELKSVGPILGYIHYTDQRTSPTVSDIFLINPYTKLPMFCTSSFVPEKTKKMSYSVIEEAIAEFSEKLASLMDRIYFIGYVPKRLLKEPVVLYDMVIEHLYLRQLNIYQYDAYLKESFLSEIENSVFSVIPYRSAPEIAKYVNKIRIMSPAFYSLSLNGDFTSVSFLNSSIAYNIIQSIASTIGRGPMFRAGIAPIYSLIEYMHTNKLLSPDTLYISDKPEFYSIYPEHTFGKVPVIHRFEPKRAAVVGDIIWTYHDQRIRTMRVSGELTLTDFYRRFMVQYLLQHLYPRELRPGEANSLRKKIRELPNLLPARSFLGKNLRKNTTYVSMDSYNIVETALISKLKGS